MIIGVQFIKRKYTNLISDKRFSEILTGSAWALGARVISAALGLVVSVVVARFYGAEVVGIVAVIKSFLMLVTIFTVLGTGTSILRLIPEHLAKYSPSSAFKVYRKTQWMVIGISVATGAASFLAAHLIADKVFSKPHLSYYFSLASVFVVFRSIMQLNTQAVRGLRLIKMFAVMQFLPQFFNLAFLIVVGFVWANRDVPVYAVLFGFAVTGLIGCVVMKHSFKKQMGPADPVHHISGRAILAISLPMLMTATMSFIIGQTGVIMLGMFCDEADVGYYAVAVKLATLTAFVLQAVNAMTGPKFSELYHSGKTDDLFHVAQKATRLIFWTTVPILAAFLFLGRPVLHLVYGQAFVIAYPALVLLVVGQFVNSISGSTAIFMNMTGNQIVLRNIFTGAAVCNIALNLLLIPRFGIAGAAFTGMLTISGWNIITLIFLKRKYGRTLAYVPLVVNSTGR